MPRVFSHGTLQREDVQVATFGRLLRGRADALPAYEPTWIPLLDERTAAVTPAHANVTFNGDPESAVPGTVFELTGAELEAADRYEAAAGYRRTEVTLASGEVAWVYFDPSHGWSAVDWFAGGRSAVGLATVLQWSRSLPAGGAVLDLGCGSGIPLTRGLANAGFRMFAVEASVPLAEACRRHVPGAEVVCEPAESSRWFGRQFDGILAVGLMFLLPARTQRLIVRKAADALLPGGRFVFTAPREVCTWADSLTGAESRSLGIAEYLAVASAAGLTLTGELTDEGENVYYDLPQGRLMNPDGAVSG